jgi:hypothetical protein
MRQSMSQLCPEDGGYRDIAHHATSFRKIRPYIHLNTAEGEKKSDWREDTSDCACKESKLRIAIVRIVDTRRNEV